MNFWIIAKPEVLIFCRQDLEQALASEGFGLHKVHQIEDWDQLSLALYADSPKVSTDQLQLQNVGRAQLLGAAGRIAEFWELTCSNPVSLEMGYLKLDRLKRSFRASHWQPGLDIYFYLGESHALYHYSYFHVPDPELLVIEKELALIRRYL